MRSAILAVPLALLVAGAAGAQAIDPAPYMPLVERYAAACQRLSPEECEFESPPTGVDAARLGCLLDQLDERSGEGTAAAHVDWVERFAATGEPPATGFPSTIGHQRTLMAAMIACRGAGGGL